MTPFEKHLKEGRFAVTVELSPPAGTNIAPMMERAETLSPLVSAFNITDNQSAVMHMSSLAAAGLVRQTGSDVIYQITGRDRNRLAIQSDLLAASPLGIGNVLALTGDHVKSGDHPETKPVFDLDSVQILTAIGELNSGRNLAGRSLDGSTDFFAGGAVAPEYRPFELQWIKMEKKIAAGARFFQTQAVFNFKALETLVTRAASLPVSILGGVLLLRSAAMADYINRRVPGLTVPPEILSRLSGAADQLDEGVSIAVEQMREMKGLCHGVHLMTAGREDLAAHILDSV